MADSVGRTVFRGGRVFTGHVLDEVDLLVEDGRIVDTLHRAEAKGIQDAHAVDVSGQIIAPGFVDAHSHSELAYLAGSRDTVKLAQGVTAEVCGQDGLSMAPVRGDAAADAMARLLGPLLDGRIPDACASITELWERIESSAVPTRLAYAVPHAALRLSAEVPGDRSANPDQIKTMQRDLAGSLESGAIGFSTGLIYQPNVVADAHELAGLAEVCAQFDVPFIVHLRNEGWGIVEAVREVVDITATAGCALHISHLKFLSRYRVGEFYAALEIVDSRRQAGQEISADQYPYDFAITYLKSLLPRAFLAGDTEVLLDNLTQFRDSGHIDEVFEDSDSPAYVAHWQDGEDNRVLTIGWGRLLLSGITGEFAPCNGLPIQGAAELMGTTPGQLVVDVLISEAGGGMVVSKAIPKEVVETVLGLSWVSVCTDGLHIDSPHPRLWGTFPRILGHYVREAGLITHVDALRKMTILPARQFGIDDAVGCIAPGRDADLVAFEPERISEPDARGDPIVGVTSVLVRGRDALNDDGPGASPLKRKIRR